MTDVRYAIGHLREHAMNKRPVSITVISWVFILAGAIGLLYHITELKAERPFVSETVGICFIRFLAIVGGVFMLRGANWARWLSIVWIGYHVILSAFHSLFEVVAHGLLFAVFAIFLFLPQASAYFRSARADRETDPEANKSVRPNLS